MLNNIHKDREWVSKCSFFVIGLQRLLNGLLLFIGQEGHPACKKLSGGMPLPLKRFEVEPLPQSFRLKFDLSLASVQNL